MLSATASVVLSSARESRLDNAPASLAIADFDGDGKLDVAAAGSTSGSVSVLVNSTTPGSNTPRFLPKQDFVTGNGPWSVAAGDLNSDGMPDLAVANSGTHMVSVLVNMTAPGTNVLAFSPEADFAAGEHVSCVALGDLNSDGRLDMVVANDGSSSISVLFNTTAPGALTATFLAKQDFAVGVNPSFVSVGDFNNDGKPDVAVANRSSSSVSVLINVTARASSTAAFAARQDYATGAQPRSIAVGDLNGDGKQDLAIANELGGSVTVMMNATAPGATAPGFASRQDLAYGSLPRGVTLGDLNGDGKLDMVVAEAGSNRVSTRLNTTVFGAAMPTFTGVWDVDTGAGPVAVALCDLNADGKPDVTVASQSSGSPEPLGTLAVHMNRTPWTTSFQCAGRTGLRYGHRNAVMWRRAISTTMASRIW